MNKTSLALLSAIAAAWSGPAPAEVDYAAQLKEGDEVLSNFRFSDGRSLPALNMHYGTLGTPRRDPSGRIVNAVMVLHGTGGSGRQFLAPHLLRSSTGPGSRSTSVVTT